MTSFLMNVPPSTRDQSLLASEDNRKRNLLAWPVRCYSVFFFFFFFFFFIGFDPAGKAREH